MHYALSTMHDRGQLHVACAVRKRTSITALQLWQAHHTNIDPRSRIKTLTADREKHDDQTTHHALYDWLLVAHKG